MMHRPNLRTWSASGSSWLGNTSDDFAVYNVEVAETRAMGRAMKLALGLNCLTAEEMANSSTGFNPRSAGSQRASDAQTVCV